jgi:hypothetical protein
VDGYSLPFEVIFDIKLFPIGCIILIPLSAGVADAKVKEETVNKNYATSSPESSPSSLPRKLIWFILR